MKIEIAEPGRMTQSGSSLLKLIQNNNMPILDLLVRESIQNSLDAKNETDPYVTVEFKTGEFNKNVFNEELEGITDALNRKYSGDFCKYLAVCDSNTVGLTGKLHYDDVVDNQYGNLLKLIYEISKPQEAEGAGGSWGLGKTVYFRIGIGLVLYYSRIVNDRGEYESRLAASLVENEMEQDSLIPVLHGKSKRGIAWWGEKIGDNKTRPITDECYIKEILQIFNIPPYEGEMTGTIIIIPYINEKNLLANNQTEYKDGEDNIIQPFWRSNIEEYLRIAVQRWYAPRLNNVKYPYGKFLRVKINNKGIALNDMEPSFQIVQALYNRASMVSNRGDILDCAEIETKTEDILLRNVLDISRAGRIAFTKVSPQILKTSFPDNKPEPFVYFNCEMRDKEKNKPVVFFTRKPGMIVSYEDVGGWVDGISSSNRDEYIFAIFVLNSENRLAGAASSYSLEEYIRKSEMADHTSWRDFSMGNVNPRIISKIQGQVNSKISKVFFAEEEENTGKINSGLGKMFGDLLLPPENFGTKPSVGENEGKRDKGITEKHKNIIFKYDPLQTEYLSTGMIVKLQLQSIRKISSTGVRLAIDSESGIISPHNWENQMGLYMPFEISKADISVLKLDDKDINEIYHIDSCNSIIQKSHFTCELIKTDKAAGYGIHISMDKKYAVEFEITVSLQLNRKDIRPLFVVEKEGER